MAKRSRSSARWLAEQRRRPVREAGPRRGLALRAAFQARGDPAFRPAAPARHDGRRPRRRAGRWSQYAARLLAGKGRVIALDLLPMPALPGVEFLQGDFGGGGDARSAWRALLAVPRSTL